MLPSTTRRAGRWKLKEFPPAMRHRPLRIVVVLLAVVASLAAAAPAGAAPAAPSSSFATTKAHLVKQCPALVAFTGQCEQRAGTYFALARAAGFDYARLWRTEQAHVRPLINAAKSTWIEGNPLYERMEG